MNLSTLLIENPIIAAIRNDNELGKVINSKVSVVFVLYGNIMNIGEITKKLKSADKNVFIHVDLIEGLKGDFAGIQYIKNITEVLGIISTKSSNIKYARQLNLLTIQRIFVIDSLSLKTGIKNIEENSPNAVEVMPGIASKIIDKLGSQINAPIIAGGLIQDKKDIMDALSAGAVAVSTTKMEVWNL